MSVWFRLRLNAETIGIMEILRQEHLDLSNPDAIADEICTYDVEVDGVKIAEVRHRYGDGAWRLVALATEAAAEQGRTSRI